MPGKNSYFTVYFSVIIIYNYIFRDYICAHGPEVRRIILNTNFGNCYFRTLSEQEDLIFVMLSLSRPSRHTITVTTRALLHYITTT